MGNPALHDEQRAWLASIVASLQSRSFYGTVTIEFAGGAMKRLAREETLKPPGSASITYPAREGSPS